MSRGTQLEVDLKRIFNRKNPRIFFDVGANVGQTARYFGRHFPKATIYSFEPVLATYNLLFQATINNPRIHPYRIAIGEIDGETPMAIMEASTWNKRLDPTLPAEATQARVETVPMRQLDTFCEDRGISQIDVLKTDCEGYDYEVLIGAKGLLSKKGIAAILCEVNFRRNREHADFFKIEHYLTAFGFSFYALYDYSGHTMVGGYSNALFVQTDLWATSVSATGIKC